MLENPTISFEVFPPKNEVALNQLLQAVTKLTEFGPEFISVTFGAGGTASTLSLKTIRSLLSNTKVSIAAHLTCTGQSKSEINQLAEKLWELGVHRIIALRGDAPNGNEHFAKHIEGYSDCVSLIKGLRAIAPFEIYVAAYPEPHPESKSPQADIEHLKRKFDAGASSAITQYFFEPEMYCRFRDQCQRAGIEQLIIPGILPVSNFAKVVEFSSNCGATVPQWMHQQFLNLETDNPVNELIAAANACVLCRELQREGVSTFHFYTMNRAELSSAVCRSLGFSPRIRRTA